MSSRVIKFEFGFYNHAPIRLTIDELLWPNNPIMEWDKGGVKYKRQFTGLYDKNGVEIYEGDVLQIDECKHNKVVEWCFEACCFVLRHLPNQPYSENFFMDEFRGVVIGNIHENKQLLGE